MSKYRNIKIHVPTPEISEKVQKKLFEDGCYWGSGELYEVKHTKSSSLYVLSSGRIEFGDYDVTYTDATEKEVPYQSILDPYYDVKIAWANGEVVQRIIQTDDGEKWVDWYHSNHLDIEAGYDWRVKPKTKTIKQWERKAYCDQRVIVSTYSSTDKSDLEVTSNHWVGEAYEAEYEVPND